MFTYREVYNDSNLLVLSKYQGIPSEPDAKDKICLIDLVKTEYGENCNLCHRLDRNTGGLILIAKNDEILNARVNKF